MPHPALAINFATTPWNAMVTGVSERSTQRACMSIA
jgi:hypothetical protein